MQLPVRFGKYELQQFLGGGMSHVFRAVDTVIGRPVAVKILTDEGCRDIEAKERFLHEARISGTITPSAGAGISGVTVRHGTITATTNSSGAYTLTGLANATYTLTPSLTGYTFTPANRSVTVNGANVTGVNFTGAPSGGGGGQTYTNANNVTIYDNYWVTSPITVSGRSGNGSATTPVAVDIKHTFRGDLRVELVAPDGSAYLLKDFNSNDSADNVIQTYTVNLSSEALNGTWYLRVSDNWVTSGRFMK